MDEKKTDKPKQKRTSNVPGGTKVLHAKFGLGTIEETIGHIWKVEFKKHGTMRIHRDYLTVV